MAVAEPDPGSPSPNARLTALVTGVSRSAGIGAAVVQDLARAGWDVATTYWAAYDERMPWGSSADDLAAIETSARQHGALDRMVIASARELADIGVTANVISPGPTDGQLVYSGGGISA